MTKMINTCKQQVSLLPEVMQYIKHIRGSMLAFGTQVRGFAPGRSRRNFRTKKSSARLPSEGR
jgi:hypothetical protein